MNFYSKPENYQALCELVEGCLADTDSFPSPRSVLNYLSVQGIDPFVLNRVNKQYKLSIPRCRFCDAEVEDHSVFACKDCIPDLLEPDWDKE